MSRRRRVLVVDDDAGIRTMLRIALHEQGYAVATSDGYGDLSVGDVDLILLDSRLGNRTARELAAEGALAGGPPVLVMTAGSDAARLAADIGAAGAIAKPFDLDVLFAAIERCLGTAER